MKNIAKNMGLGAWVMFLTSACFANNIATQSGKPVSGYDVTEVSISRGGSLSLVVKERQMAPNNCDLHVQRLEYIKALKALVVDVAPEPTCMLDVTGQRKAKIDWTMPKYLRSKPDLQILINGYRLGVLSVDQDQATIQNAQ